ncbi:MAG: DUF3810 domain-containing protein [Dyadobacter sp.]
MRKYIIAFLLPVEVVIFYIFSQNEVWVEKYYIHYIFKNLTFFLRLTLGEIDFSIGLTLFYILLFISFLKISQATLYVIRSNNTWDFFQVLFIKWLNVLGIAFGLYMVMWGLAYHRKPIAEIVAINTENISSQDLINLCERLVYLTNESRKKVPDIRFRSYKFRQFFKTAPEGYTQISKLIPELAYQHSSIKMGFTKNIMTSFKTAGLYFPFTAEANINGNLTSFEAPFVICHEMAHQLGFASEDEANYIAYLACVNNSDPAFRYSANYWVLFSAMHALKKADLKTYETLSSKIDPEVFLDNEFSRSISKKYRNPVRDFASKFIYDLFLKANSQKSGIESYNLVIELLVGEFRKNGLQYSLLD